MKSVARARTAPPAVRTLATRILLALLALLALAPASRAAAAPSAGAADPAIHYRPDAIVVRLSEAATRAAAAGAVPRDTRVASLGVPGVDAVAASLGATFEAEFPLPPREARAFHTAAAGSDEAALASFYVVHLPPGSSHDAALAAFRASPDVAAADPIARVPVEAIPDDSLFANEWHLLQAAGHDVRATTAWDVSRGDSAIVVAILDTGVLYDHPDLRGRMWTNAAERTGFPGVDDDGNGYVDDVFGWDFVALDSASTVVPGEDWRDRDNDPNDFTGHGTAVAGVVGAEPDNGIGVAGVAWDVRLMPVRVGFSAALQPSGWIDLTYAAKGFVYAARNGASVINVSFASQPQADLVVAADYATACGVTMVVAAGNGQPAHYLADRPEAVAVAATDSLDHVATFSNRGTFVTLAAPGVGIATTLLSRPPADSAGMRQPSYTLNATGTSFSAPVVAGAAALVQADRRDRGLRPLTPYELKVLLAETADDISAENPGLAGYGSGRLDARAALSHGPVSFAVRLPSPTVGPGVLLPMLVPPDRVAYATADARLVFADASPDGRVTSVSLSGPPIGGVAAADLGDGRGVGLFVATAAKTIDGFDGNGRPLPGWPVPIETATWASSACPALGDLDGDGSLEVVWGGSDGTVRAWHADGTPVNGFPRVLGSRNSEVRVALGDLDGRPGADIAAAVSSGQVWIVLGDGTSPDGWPASGTPGPYAPAIAHMGAPTRPCVVVAWQNLVTVYNAGGGTVFSVLPPGFETVTPSVADLTGDGLDEIVLVRASPESILVVNWYGRTVGAWNAGADILPSRDATILVGALDPGGTDPVVLLRSADERLFAFRMDGSLVAGFPKPGGGDPTAVYAGAEAGGLAWVASGTGPDTTLFFHRGWPSSPQSPDARPYPTARANAARTACTFYAPPLGVVDNEPPSPVSDLAAAVQGTHLASLSWTAPGGDAVGYELRWTTGAMDDASFAAAVPVPDPPVAAAPGTPQHLDVAGVAENATVRFAIRAVDAAGNPSALSNVATVVMPGDAPARVADVRVAAWTDTSVTLRWTASGDDGSVGRPARYRLRASTSPIDDQNFDAAPLALDVPASADAGGAESATLGGLGGGARWWIALVAEDASGLDSPVSNVVSAVPGPLAARVGLALAPRSRPSALPLELWWQGAGAAGPRTIRLYDVAGRLVRSLPLSPGTEGVATWDGLDREGARVRSGLYFAVLSAGGATAKARVVVVE